MAYVFVFFVGGGVSGWRSLECLVVALFLVNHHLNFMALVEHNLYLPALQAAGSGFIFAINFWLHYSFYTAERNNVPVNMLLLKCQSF
jgi:hypothetical protein